jgi:hypothetical protein
MPAQNAKLFNDEVGGTHGNHCALKLESNTVELYRPLVLLDYQVEKQKMWGESDEAQTARIPVKKLLGRPRER